MAGHLRFGHDGLMVRERRHTREGDRRTVLLLRAERSRHGEWRLRCGLPGQDKVAGGVSASIHCPNAAFLMPRPREGNQVCRQEPIDLRDTPTGE
jgi:hypothetical protein